MANIKILKEDQLVGGTDNTPVYPVSSTQAIYCQDSEGNVPQGVKPKLEDRLRDIENSMEAQGYVILNEKTIHVGNKSITVPDKVSQLANDLGYLSLKVEDAVSGNLAVLTSDGNIADSGLALSTKTAYSNKGSATKVPKISTNTLGQVTSISEVTITQPTVPDISTSISSDGASDTKTASPKAVKTYVDTATAGIVTSSTTGLKIEVVASLPANPDSNTIYIVQ